VETTGDDRDITGQCRVVCDLVENISSRFDTGRKNPMIRKALPKDRRASSDSRAGFSLSKAFVSAGMLKQKNAPRKVKPFIFSHRARFSGVFDELQEYDWQGPDLVLRSRKET